MKRRFAIPIVALLISAAASFAFPEDPDRRNHVSAEDEALVPGVAPLDLAITLARTETGSPLLVTQLEEDLVYAVNLVEHGARAEMGLFDAYATIGREGLVALAQNANVETYNISDLSSAAGSSERHLSSGTNFPEHAEETSSSSVFLFPKFGPPSPPVTTVALSAGVLLDYEVELCARFDRDIASMADFEAATIGFFLCADFTDRALLIREINPFDFGSGSGFSDAKSAVDFFPTGPFLVIPNDWESFVENERVNTHLAGELRQDARGGEMILNFRQLIERALADTESTRFTYRGEQYPLIEDAQLSMGQAVMSGTPEGVIFMPPSALQFIRGLVRYAAGGFINEPNPYDSIINSFVREETEADRFLAPGDVVRYTSLSMGQIMITVLEEGATGQDAQTGDIGS